jgi:CheY-like chemotaxis protein
MSTRERLLAISELKRAGEIERMDDDGLGIYVQELNCFIDGFAALETQIKTALEEKDYDALAGHITTIEDGLTKIHADDIVMECCRQIDNIKSLWVVEVDIEAKVTELMTRVSGLNIDIMAAVYKGQRDEQEPDAGKAEKAEKAAPQDGRLDILAVDDSTFFLNNLKSVLRGTEYKLTCAASGLTALSFLRKHSPSLFILDIEMPEMDGYELAEKIRDSGHGAPIIFLTGNATKEKEAEAIRAGASDFIVKPINKTQVLERIGRFLPLESARP